MRPAWVLALGVAACVGTFLALVRVRRPAPLAVLSMMVGWLVSELAVFHLVAQLAVAVGAAATGALDNASGRVGVGLLVLSASGLVVVQRLAGRAATTFGRALRDGGVAGEAPPPPKRQAWRPFRFDARGVEVVRDIAYGEHPTRHRLDLYRRAGTGAGDALPVVVYIHGGAWTIGNKRQQGRPLLLHLARRGYLAVSVNYRLAPRHRWPAQIVDVKRAVAWLHEHAAEYGGDPRFLAVVGGSAGGHLTALVALTAGDPAFQPGFEGADTSVTAAVPIYAPFDLTDRDRLRGRASLGPFLERLVMPTRLRDDPGAWEAASPQFRTGPDMPPIFVIQGTRDALVWREEARAFVEQARRVSRNPVAYAEVPGAQHAFDVFNCVRSREAVDAIARFLAAVRSSEQGRPTGQGSEAGHAGGDLGVEAADQSG